jgi:Leucine-rich repeat (LRR) protein
MSQVNLTTLDVGNNMIEKIENMSHLTKLQEFWVCFSSLGWSRTLLICVIVLAGQLQQDSKPARS